MDNKIKIGDIYPTNNFGYIEIIEVRGCNDIDVMFIATKTLSNTRADKVRNGGLRDKFAPTLYNKGIIGEGITSIRGKVVGAYTAWGNMLTRCYNPKYHKSFPTYTNCSVSPEWLLYTGFVKWYSENYVYGWHLDKDILGDGMLYSPETCVYLPQDLNQILTLNKSARGSSPVGVTYQKSSNKFHAQINLLAGSHSLGLWATEEEEAFSAYKESKESFLKERANYHKSMGNINEAVYTKLMEFEVSKDL